MSAIGELVRFSAADDDFDVQHTASGDPSKGLSSNFRIMVQCFKVLRVYCDTLAIPER